MKYLHKICLAAVLAVLVAVLCGCNADDYTLPAQVDMQPGESVALAGLVRYTGPEAEQATAEDAAALLEAIGSVDNISFGFASSVPGVVSVDNEGVMTAGLTGDATVIVSCASLDYYAEVRVSVRNLPQSLSVEPVAALTPGETFTLNAEVRPGKKYAQLQYASADESVATVDENGVITAVAAGETDVTAQVAGASLTAVCRVVVTQEDEMMQGVTLSRAAAPMSAGETLLLSAGAYPESDAAVLWQSADESIATVDEAGMVTAVGAGVTDVTATANGKTAACTVTVTAPTTAETATPETAEDGMEEIALDVFFEQTPESATAGSAAHDEEAEAEDDSDWPHLTNGMPLGPGPVIPQQTPETANAATPETAQSAEREEATSVLPTPQTPESATLETATAETATPETATAETALASAVDEAADSVRQWIDDLVDELLK